MRKRTWPAAALLGAGSLAIGCRSEAGTEPERERPAALSSTAGQCLGPPSAAADSTLIPTRLASRLAPGGIVCLAPEGSRWVLRSETAP